MQKGQALTLILIGVLVIAVIAGGAYYLGKSSTSKSSPTPSSSDETVNWKTYTDNTYFSVKYPPTWELELKQDPEGIYIHNPKSIKTIDAGFGGTTEEVVTEYISIFVEPSSDNAYQVAEEFIKEWKQKGIDIKSEDASGNGIDLVLYDDYGKGSDGKNVVMSNGTLLAEINSSIESLSGRRIENYILGTIKFLK